MGHCKLCIKSTGEANVLVFGINKDTIPPFVIKNFHGFSFVFWATIDLAMKFLPNVNQFFESLYQVMEYNILIPVQRLREHVTCSLNMLHLLGHPVFTLKITEPVLSTVAYSMVVR